jgi:predicted nucleic acid-binding protein
VSLLLDTSVIIASLDGDEPLHTACDRLLAQGGHCIYAHALAETFSILSGGRHARRLRPALVAQLIEDSVLPFVQLVHLTGKETMTAIADCERRGARGGAVYDLLHLAAARKAGVQAVVTLDLRDFQALSKPGDPIIRAP